MAIGKPSYRKGAKKTSDFKIGISNGKPSIQVNWGGRIYGTQLSLIGSGNVKDSLDVSDVRATGNITFGKNSAVYNNSNKILMSGGLTKSGDKNMSVGTDTNLSNMVGHADNINNIAIGDNVMNTTVNGQNNVSFGHNAMQYMGRNSTRAATFNKENIAIGNDAMKGYSDYDTVEGQYNIGIGFQAMSEIKRAGMGTNTNFNVCIGTGAGMRINGQQNIYIGGGAGAGASDGSEADYNIGMGSSSLIAIEDGDYNVGLGFETLKTVTNGYNNIAIGREAGDNITTGNTNICIGSQTDVNSTSAVGRVIISPSAATVDADNTTLIVNTDIILDAAGDITLDADGDQVSMKFGGTAGQIDFTNDNSGDGVIRQKVDDKDLVIQQFDGNEVARFAHDGNFKVKNDLILDDGGSIKEAGGTAALTIDAAGEVSKIGQDSPSDGEVLTWDNSNSKVVWSASGGGGGTAKHWMDWYYYSCGLTSQNTFYMTLHNDEYGVSSSINTDLSSSGYSTTTLNNAWRMIRFARRIPYSGTITRFTAHVESSGADADSDIEVALWWADALSDDTFYGSTQNFTCAHICTLSYDFSSATKWITKNTTSFNQTAISQDDWFFVTVRRTNAVTDGRSYHISSSVTWDGS